MDDPRSSAGRTRGRRGAARALLAAALLALATAPRAARAQVPGDTVRVETESGTLTGLLIDRLPAGYLLRIGDSTSVVPYGSVKSMVKVEAQPAPPPPPAPTPPAPVVVVLPPAPPPAPPVQAAWPTPPPRPMQMGIPELVDVGRVITGLGVAGVITGAVLAPVGYVARSNNTCHDASGTIHFQCEYGNGSSLLEAGLITLAAGSALTVGGIVMIVSGKSYRSAAAAPAILVAPRGAALQWSF